MSYYTKEMIENVEAHTNPLAYKIATIIMAFMSIVCLCGLPLLFLLNY